MAKVKVNLDKSVRDLNDAVFRSGGKKRVGEATIDAVKESIARGQSPVKGHGRFKRYAAQRGGGYPRDSRTRRRFPQKKTRPVNLSLNGWYLGFLNWFIDKKKLFIGLSSGAGRSGNPPRKAIDFYETHNLGKHPDVPQRKHLPNARGEKFKSNITNVIKDVYNREISRIIKKSNE